MSAVENFVWGIEDKIGMKIPGADAVAFLVDTTGALGALVTLPVMFPMMIGASAAAEIGKATAEGVADVLDQMKQENAQRLQLEQEFLNKVRGEREEAYRTTGGCE